MENYQKIYNGNDNYKIVNEIINKIIANTQKYNTNTSSKCNNNIYVIWGNIAIK